MMQDINSGYCSKFMRLNLLQLNRVAILGFYFFRKFVRQLRLSVKCMNLILDLHAVYFQHVMGIYYPDRCGIQNQ